MATAPEILAWTGQPVSRYYNLGRSRTVRPRSGPNTIYREAARKVDYEVHDLARRNLLVLSLLNSWGTNAVSTGITPQFPDVNGDVEIEALDRLWSLSQEELDADGLQSFYGMQAMVAESVKRSGEVFARFRQRRPRDGFRVPLQIQLLESAMLPAHSHVQTTADILPTGNRIENGIEYDPIGRRVAYHFYRNHPGEITIASTFPSTGTVRVPASDILHIGIPTIPGEKRFISPLATAVESLKIYDEARLNMADRIRIGASFAGFATRALDDIDSGGSLLGEGTPDSKGSAESFEFDGGQVIYLNEGESVTFPDMPDIGGNYLDFMQSFEQLFAAAYGMTYDQVSGNLHRVSFSSARVGHLEMRRAVLQFVARCLVFQFSSKVIRRWMQEAVISGAIDLPGYADDPTPWHAVEWRHPGWPAINPVDEVASDEKAVQAGFDSRSNIAITKYARDPKQLDNEIAADKRRAEQLELNFTTTVASGSQASASSSPIGEAERERLGLME